MTGNKWIIVGAILAAIGVALGALGAHGLENWLESAFDDPVERAKRLDNWQTAVRYHLFHAIGIILIGLASERLGGRLLNFAAGLMVVGVLLFSGCLYGWVLTGSLPLVMIVPIGGVAFIVAWLLFAGAAFVIKHRHEEIEAS